MPDHDEFEFIVSMLQDPQPGNRVNMLQILGQNPTDDIRLLPYIEALLEDRAITIVSIPFHWGEVRHEAAFALSSERAKAGIMDVVELKESFFALSLGDMAEFAEQAGVTVNWSERDIVKRLIGLLEIGAVPRQDFKYDPQ